MTTYDELGGRAIVELVVDLFYRRILADPTLAPYFANIDIAAQMRRQCQFLAFALGRVSSYDVGSIRDTHRPLKLNDAEFDRVSSHLATALAEVGASPPAIDKVMAIVETTRLDILGPSDPSHLSGEVR